MIIDAQIPDLFSIILIISTLRSVFIVAEKAYRCVFHRGRMQIVGHDTLSHQRRSPTVE